MIEVWGILNVTPDSFSDGGLFTDAGAAIAHARRMRAQGADVIDIGGESTRPGATPITPAEEQARILPVITELAREGMRISVDTVHAVTAQAAVAAGAEIVNDVTGGQHDPDMLAAVAATEAKVVLMHSRGIDVLADIAYDDVVQDVRAHLVERRDAALAAGIPLERIIFDPGFGFSKGADDNWRLLAGLGQITGLGGPVLVGTSRKRFLGDLLPEGANASERDAATAATSLLAAQHGAAAVRVHDVTSTVAALRALERTNGAIDETRRPTHWITRLDDAGGSITTSPTVRVDGIRARGYHGVLSEERRDGQEFVVDVELRGKLANAAHTDDLEHTVNYAAVAESVVRVVEGDPVDLIETLARRIGDACLEFPLVEHASVTVHKPSAPIPVPFGDVTVSIDVSRGGTA
ncbi:MAG TPA: dihydropteroate synthase [Candidatus Agrococcus pullicola]|uniref:7,8-dihydroneopterin aldolase n=1 Tax=Candidatus Agrococcus pullicola TaxID=2838429 RepID=A0A9D1YV42_9MICO|nr:dihydropteroate synthase [Candidatus Agrococcus pullicola]